MSGVRAVTQFHGPSETITFSVTQTTFVNIHFLPPPPKYQTSSFQGNVSKQGIAERKYSLAPNMKELFSYPLTYEEILLLLESLGHLWILDPAA